jgi:protein-tyrosine phosphatase
MSATGAPVRVLRVCMGNSRRSARALPDPYGGGEAGFEQVLDLIEDACAGLPQQLRAP